MKTVHEHSREALQTTDTSARRKMVFDVLRAGGSFTDREIKELLGFSDMNSVRPRITELKRVGLVEEAGKKKDPLTGKTVRLVRAVIKERLF